MEGYPPGIPFFNSVNGPDLTGSGKPPFLTALTLILELSFYFHQPADIIAVNMHRSHVAFRIFTPNFIGRVIGTEGPGVLLPGWTPGRMIEYAVGILKIIIDLHDNSCTIAAIVQQLGDSKYHQVPRDMIVMIMDWNRRYQEF